MPASEFGLNVAGKRLTSQSCFRIVVNAARSRWLFFVDTNMITTVGIVEDDGILRGTLLRLVGEAQGFQCVAACATGEEALQKLPPSSRRWC